ncbi:hypothetical protein VNO77_39093 [Canavalia gladiata]|uniref:Uncharacterized protein n=1 Tax=Canavalia gladiata TaxID=3824 RepID=A0AAN9KBK7_CANGL
MEERQLIRAEEDNEEEFDTINDSINDVHFEDSEEDRDTGADDGFNLNEIGEVEIALNEKIHNIKTYGSPHLKKQNARKNVKQNAPSSIQRLFIEKDNIVNDQEVYNSKDVNEKGNSIDTHRAGDIAIPKDVIFMHHIDEEYNNQQKGLIPVFEEMVQGVEHRFCLRHLYNNFKKKFGGGTMIRDLMMGAAKCTYIEAWEDKMNQIKKINSKAYDWLSAIPTSSWCKHAFSHYPRLKQKPQLKLLLVMDKIKKLNLQNWVFMVVQRKKNYIDE